MGTFTAGTLSATTISGGTVSATDFSCTDCLDFPEFEDQLDLDASTDIAADNAEVLSITNTGTGNSFLVNPSIKLFLCSWTLRLKSFVTPT